MRILISSQYDSKNTYVTDIVDGLKSYTDVICSISEFWESEENYDIVHLQWPEELFHWNTISKTDLQKIKDRFNYYKSSGTKLVATLHNEIPHRSKTDFEKELYNFVYNEVDAIVNLGNYSTSLFPNKKNVVIHHPNYDKHIKVDQKIRTSFTTFLSFGTIRTLEEESQIISGFIKANIKDSKLIIANSLVGKNPYFNEGKLSLRKWKYIFYLRRLQNQNIQLINRRLTDEEMNFYFNQADVVISPRIENLNSGVVFLGFSFGKPVVGPNIGNIGEFLTQTNNPTFEPKNPISIAAALKNALKEKNLGQENSKFSKTNLNADKIALEHYKLYQELKNS